MLNSTENRQIPQDLIDKDIILFDGDCVLCHNMMRLILEVDEDKHFLLCSQQSEMGHLILERHQINVDDLSTVYVVTNCGTDSEHVLDRSSAAVYVMTHTKKYRFLGNVLSMIPRTLRDLGYKFIANIRYRVFGKTNAACNVPNPEDRSRIIG